MFNLFKKKDKKKNQPERVEPQMGKSPGEQALFRTIEEKEKEDPLIGLKIGSEELKANLFEHVKDEHGVHIETALGVLGSLAGNYCLIGGVAVQQATAGEAGRISRIEGADGNTYYMGDLINKPLLTDPLSVWELVGGMAQQIGATEFPDIKEIVEDSAQTIGREEFGIPRIEEKHKLRKTPVECIEQYHPILVQTIIKFTKNPVEFPILVGLAIQKLMDDAKDVIDPAMAAKIVMECAVPMSKTDTSGMMRVS